MLENFLPGQIDIARVGRPVVLIEPGRYAGSSRLITHVHELVQLVLLWRERILLAGLCRIDKGFFCVENSVVGQLVQVDFEVTFLLPGAAVVCKVEVVAIVVVVDGRGPVIKRVHFKN